MARISLVTADNLTAEQQRVWDAMLSGQRKSAPVGPLAVAMHRPELAEAWSALGLVLRFNSSFPPRLREFTILLTGRYWDCQFEWASHEGEAVKAGLSADSIETLRTGGTVFAQPDEQAIHDYAIELLTTRFASEANYRRIQSLFGTGGVVELTALIGYYAMVALTLNAHEVGVEEGRRLPPRTAGG
jgi:4-carboxymuconolactone decarboxylase